MRILKNIYQFGKLLFLLVCVGVVAGGFLASFSYSGENSDSVVLVHLVFKNDKWSLGPDGVVILPCQAPRKQMRGSNKDPLYRVLGTDGQVLLEWHMVNPRLISIEDPTTQTKLLDEVSFKLRFPLIEGMQEFEFWYEQSKQKKPSVTADLRPAIGRYTRKGGARMKAPCQEPEYMPDQRGKKKN